MFAVTRARRMRAGPSSERYIYARAHVPGKYYSPSRVARLPPSRVCSLESRFGMYNSMGKISLRKREVTDIQEMSIGTKQTWNDFARGASELCSIFTPISGLSWGSS